MASGAGSVTLSEIRSSTAGLENRFQYVINRISEFCKEWLGNFDNLELRALQEERNSLVNSIEELNKSIEKLSTLEIQVSKTRKSFFASIFAAIRAFFMRQTALPGLGSWVR